MTIGILKRAIHEAEKSKIFPYRVGCVIFKGKKIFSSGYNQIRNFSFIPPTLKSFPESLHAEQHAIGKVQNKKKIENASILVIRINKSGQLMMARPCAVCMLNIKKNNIQYMFYSNSDGEIISEKIV